MARRISVQTGLTALIVLLGIALMGPVWGQEFRGSILGRIADSTGAVVPGASITITNEETNVTQTAVSNDEGNYVVPFLMPGRYTVSAELPGFKKTVRNGVVVQVRDKIVLDFALEVGEISQSITVNSETPLLRVADANLGQVVDQHFLQRLPIAGQSALSMADMAPGVISGSGGVTSNAQNDTAIGGGGGQDRGNEVTVDGIPNVAPRQRGLAVTQPMSDAVEEFRVQTTMFDASNGRSNGGVLAVSTKSGTNQLNGTAYGYVRNRALDANSWTNNKLHLDKPPVHYNVWGGTVGGPVRLPFYSGTDRTFFFFGFEKTSNARSITRQARVPTALERKGDFSQTMNTKGTALLQLYDPYTTVLDSAGKFKSRTVFTNATIPTNRLSPVGLAVLEQLPLPNRDVATQINLPNWAMPSAQTVDTQNLIARIDHNLSSRQRFYARFAAVKHDSTVDPIFFPGAFSIPPEGTTDLNFDNRRNKSFAIDDTFTFSPSFVASFRYGYTRTFIDVSGDGDKRDASILKLPQVILDNQTGGGFPIFNMGESTPQIGSRTRLSVNDIHAIFATFNKLSGNHTFNFGTDYRLIRWNENNPNTYAVGQFQFNTTFTRAKPNDSKTADTSGSGMASLLLGLPTTGGGSRIGFDSPLSLQTHYLALFVQDDFKIAPRFTLNLGLRWEMETPYTERYDRLNYGFDPNAVLPISAPGFSTLKGGMLFVTKDGIGRYNGVTDKNNFGPRVGFAFSLDPKTVIRGGYGIFFSSAVVNQQGGTPRTSPSFGAITPYVGSSDSDFTPLPGVNLSNPFPAGVDRPTGSSLGTMTEVGKVARWADPDRVLPYVEQWQLGIQRELPWESALSVAYAGNHMLKGFEHGLDLNQLVDSQLSNVATVPNPFFGILPASSTIGGAKIAGNRLTVRFPQFNQVLLDSDNTGRALYHSLQTQYQKRTSHGLTVVGAYTYSKVILYQMTSLVNPRAFQKSIPVVDFPHIFRLFATYDLPVGRAGSVGKGLPVWADYVVGGWSLTWNTEYTSGLPLGFTDNNLDKPIPSQDPRTSGSVKDRLGDQIDPATKLPINPYFRASAFTRMVDQYAVSPEPNQYGWLRGPAVFTHSATLFKNFRLFEDVSLELRAEIRNPFNSPLFSNPVTNISGANFGVIESTVANSERNILVGAKLRF